MAKEKATNKAAEKAAAKVAKTVAKAAKPTGKAPAAKGKAPAAAAKGKASKAAPAERDRYGLRVNSLRSEAAALYGSEKGATLHEVQKATGSPQLNVIKDLAKNGWKVVQKKEEGPNGKQVTRYFLKGKGPADKDKKLPAKGVPRDNPIKPAKVSGKSSRVPAVVDPVAEDAIDVVEDA